MLAVPIVVLGFAATAAASPLSFSNTSFLFPQAICPVGGEISCQARVVPSNLCCFESPGGQLVQTQFWNARPSKGPVNSWTIHGLWPDHCNGKFDSNCDRDRAYKDIDNILRQGGASDVLSYMKTYWPDIRGRDESFWQHEWAKHGTCMSTLQPACISSSVRGQDAIHYFRRTVNLFKTLSTYQFLGAAGIYPSSTRTYTLSQLQSAVKAKWGYMPAFGCKSGSLNAVSYYYNLRGSIINGALVPINAPREGSCRSSNIKYLPKSGSSTPTTDVTAPVPAPTSTSSPETRRATIMGLVSGKYKHGCLLANGVWSSQICATFTLTRAQKGFTIRSSKGLCQIHKRKFSCNHSIKHGTVFTHTRGLLTYQRSTLFTGASIPRGSKQVSLSTGKSSGYEISLPIIVSRP